MARIVIADVEENLASVLKCELEQEGHLVKVENCGALSEGLVGGLAACDAMLLDMQAFSLNYRKRLRQIKKSNPETHILIYANSAASDVRSGLIEAGAEECFGSHEIQRLKKYLRALTGVAPRMSHTH
jgi:DNA-binding NarL/FixJ family response regulator